MLRAMPPVGWKQVLDLSTQAFALIPGVLLLVPARVAVTLPHP